MFAEGNSSQSTCDPLSGKLIYGSIGEFTQQKEYIVMTAPLNSRSEFYGSAQGAGSEISSLAALVGAVRAVANFTKQYAQSLEQDPKEIILDPPFFGNRTLVFGLFPGSTFGNFGAHRFVCNIRKGQDEALEEGKGKYANISFDRIKGIISLGELSGDEYEDKRRNKDIQLFIHKEHTTQESSDLQQLALQIAQDAKQEEKMYYQTILGPTSVEETPGIPPSPASAFIEENNSIPIIHICSHGNKFSNPFHHSRLDQYYDSQLTCDASTLAARIAVQKLMGDQPDIKIDTLLQSIQANCTEIHQMLECLISNSSCELIRQTLKLRSTPKDDFMSNDCTVAYRLFGSTVVPIQSAMAARMLQNAVGKQGNKCSKADDCDKGQTCEQGTCYITPIYIHS
ncbi:MAG: putative nicastrin protein, partial [Streblomastix strix]